MEQRVLGTVNLTRTRIYISGYAPTHRFILDSLKKSYHHQTVLHSGTTIMTVPILPGSRAYEMIFNHVSYRSPPSRRLPCMCGDQPNPAGVAIGFLCPS